MKLIKTTYLISAVYDLLFGIIFLLFPAHAFNLIEITAPNHWGYVTFIALILIIFSLMFFEIAKDPIEYKKLIPYSAMLKASYCGTVFGYMIFSSIPMLWVIFGIFDLAFLIIFIYAYKKIK